jgi:hypothetical protein
MPTKTVRLLADDVALVHRLSTLGDNLSFAVKAHTVLRDLLGRQDEVDHLRRMIREELDRISGGP